MTRIATVLTGLVLLCTLAGGLACERVQDRIIRRAAREAVAANHDDWLTDGDLHVYLCGTGSPLPELDRAGPCTAVVAGGAMYVVDSGPGSTERLQVDHLPLGALRAVFLTHYHSDHIGDLGELHLQSWAGGGRRVPLDVYGPPGVQRVVDGFSAAYALDAEYRVAHHGADILPPAGGEMVAHTFVVPEDGGIATVFEANGLKVTSVAVDHRPVVPAVAYRFDYAGRSVVVSGDTRPSQNLVHLATHADLLVHEVLAGSVVKIISRAAYEAGNERLGKIMSDVLEYHTTPAQAVEIARQAKVNTIVFSHRVPPLPEVLAREAFMRGVDDGGEVTVVLGEDGMHFCLPADGGPIQQESL